MFYNAYKLESNIACRVASSGEYFALGTAVLAPDAYAFVDAYIGRSVGEALDQERVIQRVEAALVQERAMWPRPLLEHVAAWTDVSEPPRVNHISVVKKCMLRNHVDDPRDHMPGKPPERDELVASWVITQAGVEPIAYLSPDRERVDNDVDIWPRHAGPEKENVALEVLTSWRGGQAYSALVALGGLEKVIYIGSETVVPPARLEA